MKILVTGGTGFVGKPLVRTLVAKGQSVTVFARQDDIDRPDGVGLIAGDICDKGLLRPAVKGIDCVFHLASCKDETDKRLWQTNVEGTKILTELCREQKVKRIIYLSHAGVLGEHFEPAHEHAAHKPQSKYDKSVAAAENIIRHCGVPYTIVRSPPILGTNKFWLDVIHAARKSSLDTGSNKFHVIHLDDAVKALFAMLTKTTANQIFHIGTKDIMTSRELIDALMKETKTKSQERSRWSKIIGNTEIEPHHAKLMKRNFALSTRKAKEILGFEPYYTTPAGIHEMVKEMNSDGLLAVSSEKKIVVKKARPEMKMKPAKTKRNFTYSYEDRKKK